MTWSSKRVRGAVVFLILGLWMRPAAWGQDPDFDKVQIQTIRVAETIYMLLGAGGNIGVSVGEDGVFLVDDQYAPLHQKIKDALAKISKEPVHFVLNTHWHWDHTGGNELMGKTGAVIIAHDNVRKRLSSEQFTEFFQRRSPAAPKAALPVVTFTSDITVHYNGEDIYAFHVDPAHTDTDSMVYFRRSNVLHTGDVYNSASYPFLDLSSGGSINGIITAMDQILQKVRPDTKVIPGHGPLSDVPGIRSYRDMLTTIRDRILSQVRAGKTMAEVVASKPTAEFDPNRKGVRPSDDFVKMIYQDLSRK